MLFRLFTVTSAQDSPDLCGFRMRTFSSSTVVPLCPAIPVKAPSLLRIYTSPPALPEALSGTEMPPRTNTSITSPGRHTPAWASPD